ncbi:N-acetylglucosamine-6-phosphate deacetylase [Fonticella tunisiensis]|uniref:N-acetylglucosamine-6-phosphate deacetylase n=1 Tax=Fonticella tunisiensis TaxID=1096341 RepID=A0A4R7KAJ1_9CLOT|nr:N-acetylglucosamine-6-phosphate deacetylase [Fonticella tunisiensis]TDT51883.1 N-acetylglucosamine 6-phosphate deacetylase [Fonticella tunisiensis]
MKAIINGKIIMENEVISGKALLFDEKINGIVDREALNDFENLEIIDAEDNYVSPGLIDVHIHGSGGRDTMEGTMEALETISRSIAGNGVTSFLPTTMTMDRESIYRAFDAVREAMKINMPGAQVLGTHMEGPFINEKYKGAQNPKYIVEPDYDFIKDYLDVIKILTFAPEKDENHKFIDKMKEHEEIVLSIGHSNATYAQAMEAIERGVRHVTHTFNAMTPLNHREPGIVGAAFRSNITCELIADTIHVHPAVFKILKDIKGNDKVVLITDCMMAGCMEDGVYELGGQKVVVKDRAARLEDGTLAGSVLTLNRAIKNMLDNTDLEVYEAVAMASLNPARVIGMDDVKGSIKKGKDADLVIFDDEFNAITTIVKGNTVFNKR